MSITGQTVKAEGWPLGRLAPGLALRPAALEKAATGPLWAALKAGEGSESPLILPLAMTTYRAQRPSLYEPSESGA
jgi:hypothetical protein